jgi:hypothetical protein
MKEDKLNQQGPEAKRQLHAQMAARVRAGDQAAKAEVIGILQNRSLQMGSNEKNLALELIEKNKMKEAVPALYPLLKEVVASGIGEKAKDPSNALILIGKEGLPALLECLEQDEEQAIPYQTIASIMFHWFGGDKAALRTFLAEKEKEAAGPSKNKFGHLIEVVDTWK